MASGFTIENIDGIKETVENVRCDSSSVNWVLVGHINNDQNLIGLEGFGEGSVPEMVTNLRKDGIQYALVRISEDYEMTHTIKFVYIKWIGEEVPFAKRGRYSVMQSQILPLFTPSHVSIDTSDIEEITDEKLLEKIKEHSGTKSKVVIDGSASNPRKSASKDAPITRSHTYSGRSNALTAQLKSTTAEITFNEAALTAIKNIRSDSMIDNWCILAYEAATTSSKKLSNKLVLKESGEDWSAATCHFGVQDPLYCFMRVFDSVEDNIKAPKFVLLTWVPESAGRLIKAIVPTHKGAILDKIGFVHVNYDAHLTADITMPKIMDKVMSASGSKINVK